MRPPPGKFWGQKIVDQGGGLLELEIYFSGISRDEAVGMNPEAFIAAHSLAATKVVDENPNHRGDKRVTDGDFTAVGKELHGGNILTRATMPGPALSRASGHRTIHRSPVRLGGF